MGEQVAYARIRMLMFKIWQMEIRWLTSILKEK